MATVSLQCIKERSKLRVRITSAGYNNNANCQFPKAIRVEGRRYKCPVNAITVAGGGPNGAGKFFYRISKNLVEIVSDEESKMPEKVYDCNDCVICLEEGVAEIVIISCGHLCLCSDCAKQMNDKCPMCRGKITGKIHKDQLR